MGTYARQVSYVQRSPFDLCVCSAKQWKLCAEQYEKKKRKEGGGGGETKQEKTEQYGLESIDYIELVAYHTM